MDELMTVADAMRYINLAEKSAEALSQMPPEGSNSVVVDRQTVAEASACLMKFKSILTSASVLFN